MTENNKLPQFSSWSTIEEHLLAIKAIQGSLGPPNVGISSSEIYQIAEDIVRSLIFLVKEDHFRTPKENPKVIFIRDTVDELGNPKSIRVRPPRDLVGPDDTEINSLELILEDLISLRRNRFPSRWRKAFHHIFRQFCRKRGKGTFSKKFQWWFRK